MFILSCKQRNVVLRFFVMYISLNLGAGFPVLTLALPVEEVGINRVILIHRGRGKVLLRFIEINEEDIR